MKSIPTLFQFNILMDGETYEFQTSLNDDKHLIIIGNKFGTKMPEEVRKLAIIFNAINKAKIKKIKEKRKLDEIQPSLF